uniref:Uncharacterized protein n=1 Tax=Nelumbo nucifera TaxID=4432 RepID=A0A822Z8I6_NELNU|nr:TPA_asm: hypothetical protein HUJ06_015196 [Nelumbo nucifera]
MDRSSSSEDIDNEVGLVSCWGQFKLKLSWPKGFDSGRQRNGDCNFRAVFGIRQSKRGGGFRYDPLSYAQNFDEGCWDEDNGDSYHRGFSSRFAAPASKTLAD